MATFKAIILKGDVHLRRDGTKNVKIRIIHKGKADYISTGLYVAPENFDVKSGTMASGPNKQFINYKITQTILGYQKKEIEIGDRLNYMGVQDVKEYFTTEKKTISGIDFFDFVLNVEYESQGTREQYDALISSLKSFAGDRLPVSSINLNFLRSYESFLRRRGVKNGIINYMRTFRTLFNKCRDFYNNEDIGEILIPQYPFKKYRFPKRKEKSRGHFLTIDELREFINYKPSSPGEDFAKDMFLLMFYLIGIESKDLFYLSKHRAGRANYDRFKTGGEFSIKIEPEAEKIISKYPGKDLLINAGERFMHHKSFTRFVNSHLHGEKSYKNKPGLPGIFPALGISKPVTTKWARHTWATIARNHAGISKDDVALCLGHQDIDNRVTDTYLHYDYSIIDNSNRIVIDLL